MGERKKKRSFKITDDTLTSIVIYSLLFCAVVTVVGMVLGAFDHDVSSIVDSTHRVFGTELGICGLLKSYERWVAAQDRRAEERRQRENKDQQEKEAYVEGMRKNETERNNSSYSTESAYG